MHRPTSTDIYSILNGSHAYTRIHALCYAIHQLPSCILFVGRKQRCACSCPRLRVLACVCVFLSRSNGTACALACRQSGRNCRIKPESPLGPIHSEIVDHENIGYDRIYMYMHVHAVRLGNRRTDADTTACMHGASRLNHIDTI